MSASLCSAPPLSATPEESQVLLQNHAKRSKKRKAEKVILEHIPKGRAYERYVTAAQPAFTNCVMEHLPATRGGYSTTNPKQTARDREPQRIRELIEEGMSIVEWNGFDPKPLVDVQGHVIAVLLGQPQTERYQLSATAIYDLLDWEAVLANFGTRNLHHGRGRYPAVKVGIIHQQGTKQPMNLSTWGHTEMMGWILANANIYHLANFAS
ncbi:hypothetical protein H0H87_006867, partial [Tephrocybe sp. NHM501043]